ncbi:hypothetical protein B7R22_11825 [Subtercola boreus]|uniref:Uncharacterized protein n=1 Tax=Subtercola boreus TaxID=120213 RepID=A0A3E0VW11_9MICO|nr:hypothetical protein [Subtercola boreus]RFA13775.1 hypothetical protein B7R22_11825 [Subtercola boreus]
MTAPIGPASPGPTIEETQPHAVYSPTPWSDEVWFMAHDGRCLGWILRYAEGEKQLFGVYTYGCDERGLRVWVASETTLARASAYMGFHVRELLEQSRQLAPDPVNPLGLHERRQA